MHPSESPNKRRPLPLAVVYSLYSWGMMFFVTVAFYLFGLIFVLPFSILLDKGSRKKMHGVSRLWAKCLLSLNPGQSRIFEGLENLQPGTPYVIVGNHQSIVDIFVVLAGLDTHFKFLAKRELFSIPFLGWHLGLAGYVPLVRGNKESARQAVAEARRLLQNKIGVLFFPEGTRSEDGEIKEFKSGAFKVASDENVSILPVVIDGTGKVIPKHSWLMRDLVRLRMRVLKPVPPPSRDPAAIEKTRQEVEDRMRAELAAIRAGK